MQCFRILLCVITLIAMHGFARAQAVNLLSNSNSTSIAGSDIGARINTMVRACAGAVCPIQIPPGSYLFSTPVVLASNVELYGSGEYQTKLIYRSTARTSGITAGSGTTNVNVHDLSVLGTEETLGSSATYNTAIGISINGTHSLVDKVAVSHFWEHGGAVTIERSFNTISNSDLEYDEYPLEVGGLHNIVKHNYLSNHYSTARTFEVPGVHYWDCLTAEGATSLLIESNVVEDCGQSGIYIGANEHITLDTRIIGNHILHAWNRGIDAGVTGDLSPTNAVIGFVISSNTVIDSRLDNIWLVCDAQGSVSANYTVYTTSYSSYFGATLSTTRSGIAIYDGCAAPGANFVTYNSVTGNTVIDMTGTAQAGLAFNVQN